MKVWEALEILDQLDPLEEVTIIFGKEAIRTGDWIEHRNLHVRDKNWWLNPTMTKTYDNDRMH